MEKQNKISSRMEIRKMNRLELEKHFNDFLALFAENTRGHVIDQVIEDKYILFKASELFAFLDQGKAILLGAFAENRLVGFLWAYPRIFLEESRLYINAMIIADKYRGKRIGKMLVLQLEEYARENNIFAIDVQTASFKTEAIEFYRRLGFEHERVQMRKSLDMPKKK